MKPVYVLLATAAIFASAACNAENKTSGNSSAPIEAIKAPNGDWTKMVSATPEGGFLMGNPNADVKLVELGSMTCPHCAEFSEQADQKLINEYVKIGPGQLRVPQLRPRRSRHDRLADRPLRRARSASSR